MKINVLLLPFCLYCLLGSAQRGIGNFGTIKARDDVAKSKLTSFANTLNESNMRNFGFTSFDDLKNAALSNSFELDFIPLDQLKTYNNTTNVNTLITHTRKYIYPIINTRTQQITNAMNVDYTNSQWNIVSMGRGKLLATSIYSEFKRSPGFNYSVVSIPSLNLDFIAYTLNSVVMMIPLTSDVENKLEAGKPVSASKVLAIYSVAAKRYNGLPM